MDDRVFSARVLALRGGREKNVGEVVVELSRRAGGWAYRKGLRSRLLIEFAEGFPGWLFGAGVAHLNAFDPRINWNFWGYITHNFVVHRYTDQFVRDGRMIRVPGGGALRRVAMIEHEGPRVIPVPVIFLEDWEKVATFLPRRWDLDHRATWWAVNYGVLAGLIALARHHRVPTLGARLETAEAEIAVLAGEVLSRFVAVEDLRSQVHSVVLARSRGRRKQLPAAVVGRLLSLGTEAVRTRVSRVKKSLERQFGGQAA